MKNHCYKIIYLTVICLVMALIGATSAFAAEDPAPVDPTTGEEQPVLTPTKISGVPAKLSKNASNKASFTIKVTPADGIPGRLITRRIRLRHR